MGKAKTVRCIRFIALTLVSACVLSGTMASTSMARLCVKVEKANGGKWTNSICTEAKAGQAKEWVKIQKPTQYLGNDQWCAEVEKSEVSNYTDPGCQILGVGGFIKIALRQHWQIKGEVLEKGSRPVKLQLKGIAKLSLPSIPLTFECRDSAVEDAAIEGQGKNRQGQDKGRIVYKECKTSLEGCSLAEPIVTNQIKSYLAVAEEQTKVASAVDVFEPEKGKLLAELKLKGPRCGVLEGTEPVDGSLVAEVLPENLEVKEGLFNFPEIAIDTVETESGEPKVGLTVGGLETEVSAAYGAQLESGEKFGIGG
jgi:hypothetical protein